MASLRTLALLLLLPLLACLPPATAAAQAADAAAAVACTRAHWGEPFPSVVLACWKQNEAAAADAVADLELLIAGSGGTPLGMYLSHPAVAKSVTAKRAASAQKASP